MKQVLFVDDEPAELEGLRRMLRLYCHEWNMRFVTSGQDALRVLADAPVDVIVSDMVMPGLDGAALLNEVQRRYPHVVRIAVSDPSDHDTIRRSLRATHQALAKPWDPGVVWATVLRACARRDLLSREPLRTLVSGMPFLPSLPRLYTELMEEVRSPTSSIKRAAQIIARDLGMTTKLLQLVNSAFFGQGAAIASAFEAVRLLGLDTVRALVLSDAVFAQYRPVTISFFSIETLWQHSLATSVRARALAKWEGAATTVVEEAFTAGLLHDVGTLVLVANLPEPYADVVARACAEGRAEWEVERQVFGAAHAEVGAYLLGLWGVGDAIVEAVAYHHAPCLPLGHGFSPLTAVHVANVLEQEAHVADLSGDSHALDRDYLERLGLADRLPEWRALCRAPSPYGDPQDQDRARP